MAFYTYMVECADGTLYAGWTTDLIKRLAAHNNGSGAKYTRGRTPVRLVYYEESPDQGAARSRESAIKRLPRAKKAALIAQFNTETMGSARAEHE